jgi:hypothetical protein
MPMETINDQLDVELKDMQLYTMKIELMEFLYKMKLNGFLESVEFRDILTELEQNEL